MTTNSPRLRTHSHILVVCVKYADFLPGDLTRNYSPNLSDTKTILTHTRTTGSKSVWFTIQVFRTRGIETGVPQIRCVCVCVCARARNHICVSHIRIVKCSPWRHSHGLLIWIGINSRFPALHGCRFSVQNQTGPCHDWCMEILFVMFKQSTYLVCVATPKSRWQTRSRTRKTGTSENMKRVGRIILSPRSLTCHPTHCPHKDRMHSEIHWQRVQNLKVRAHR
jgi:hypothetical protein